MSSPNTSPFGDYFQRLQQKDASAILSAVIFLIFFVIWWVAFGMEASKVGSSETFGLNYKEYSELAFPTFQFRTWDDNYISAVCRHCHWGVIGENCLAQPFVQSRTTAKTPDGNSQTIVFNYNGQVISDATTESVIRCDWSAAQGNPVTLFSVYEGASEPFNKLDRPGGRGAYVVKQNAISFFSMRKIITKWKNGTSEVDYRRSATEWIPTVNQTEGSTVYLHYNSYLVATEVQNDSGFDKQDFWSFMGAVGGISFLFYIIHSCIVGAANHYVFKNTGTQRGYDSL